MKGAVTGLLILASGLTVAGLAPSASAAAPTVNLGSASNFSVLAAAAATVPGATIPGEVGAGAALTTDAGTVLGSTLHTSNDAATMAALADATTAYQTLSALAPTGTLTGDDLAGQVVKPGVYRRVAAYAMTTPVTFDAGGNSNAYFIMQGSAALNTTAGTTMNLVNGAQASHIFWVTVGAATLGASSNFYGTMLSGAAVTVGASTHVHGAALSVGAAVTLGASVTFSPISSL